MSNDLEARYRNALNAVANILTGFNVNTHEYDPEELTERDIAFMRKVVREAIPDHPGWLKLAHRRRLQKPEISGQALREKHERSRKPTTAFLDALDEIKNDDFVQDFDPEGKEPVW